MSERALQLQVRDDGIGVLTFDQPGSRANTMSQAILGELEELLPDLEKKALRALLLRSGKPGMFIAGADLKELGSKDLSADQARKIIERGLGVIGRIENLPYPTAACIEGACMGGGLELALGFDYRVASNHPKTDIGLPETKIGLIPGWGGTQRLPRLIGPALAAELICAGETVKAKRALDLGIVKDVVAPEQLVDETVRLLTWSKESEAWQGERQRKQQPVGLSEQQAGFIFAVAKAQVAVKTKGLLPAPPAALEAIARGCNLTLEEGLKVETEQFLPLAGSSTSRNLIAVFFMTQRLQKDAGVADASIKPKEISRVGVIGAGIMGAGIAGAHIRRGVSVVMLDTLPGAIEKGVGTITRVLQARIDIGRSTQDEMLAALGKLSTATQTSVLADREVVIEAIVENEEAKTKLYRKLPHILEPEAILASNTSTISITRMAEAWPKPERFAGMHFFNPVDRMQLVEVIRGVKTSDETVVTLVALAKKIGKTPIVVNDCPGFLVNRILFPYLNESLVLLEEGVSPRLLDKVASKFGMPMGPVTLNDLVGLDTSLYAGRVINTAFAERAAESKILDELVGAGRLGQKSGAGFYSYAKAGRGADDPAFEAILAKCRKGSAKEYTPEELTERLFLPMLTEASRVLEEKIVREPADVDMGLILGIGFPAFRGGILRWADELGLPAVLEKLKKYESLGKRYQPTEQLKQLASAGQGFYR